MSTDKTNLFPEVRALEGDDAAEHGVHDEGLVVHQLVGGERCHGVEEERGRVFEVAHGHAVHPAVYLQSVPPVPVAAFVYQTENVNQNFLKG